MSLVLAVRYIGLAALVAWLGGMIVLGLLVAPSIFRVLQASDPTAGRVLAGAVFGDILRRFHLLAYVCGGLLLTTLMLERLGTSQSTGSQPRGLSARAAIVLVMLAVAAYSGFPLTREIARVQSQVQGPMNKLPPSDPRRVLFDRLHATSTTLMTVNMALGLVLLFWYVRE